jgi:hypothetical protein
VINVRVQIEKGLDVNVKLLVVRDAIIFVGNTLKCIKKAELKANGKRVKVVPERNFTNIARNLDPNPERVAPKQ